MLTSDSSDTSSYGLSNTVESSKNILYSTGSLPHTLDDLLASMKVPQKEARQPPPARSKCSTRNESVLINLDVSDGETSISDSGSESPVYVQLPPEPVIQEHTVSTINAKVSLLRTNEQTSPFTCSETGFLLMDLLLLSRNFSSSVC